MKKERSPQSQLGPEHNLSLSSIQNLIVYAGAERVHSKVVRDLREVLAKIAVSISSQALKYASHANRKTIMPSDLELALEPWNALLWFYTKGKYGSLPR